MASPAEPQPSLNDQGQAYRTTNPSTERTQKKKKKKKKSVRHALYCEDWTPLTATRSIYSHAVGHENALADRPEKVHSSPHQHAETVFIRDLIRQPQARKRTRPQSAKSQERWPENTGSRPAHANAHRQANVPIPSAPQDLSFAEQRLGTLSMFSILEHARYHKILIESASSSIDNHVPVTLKQAFRTAHKDLMPDLDLPLGLKKRAGFCTLSHLKSQRDWHNVLVARAKSHTDQRLPKHVEQYRNRKQRLNQELMASLARRNADKLNSRHHKNAASVGRRLWGLDSN
jgi:hypothetical protein